VDGVGVPGELIAGRYRVVRPLAAGGLGRVWLAVDERLHCDVAIKQCSMPDGLNRAEQTVIRTWLVREARAAARVQHPNVVRILDVLPEDGQPWTVMEYVPSRSLLKVINDSGPLPPVEVAEIGLALLAALQAANRAGVRHLDVKPSNVLIGDDGRVVLTDFGPAVTDDGIRALSRAGIVLGSPNYVAPERLFDEVATERADLWSLGATLYHAVEGRPPYRRETAEATLQAITDDPPDRTHRAGPLTPVLGGLLQRDPAARMTAADAEDALRQIVNGARDQRHTEIEQWRPRPVRRRMVIFAASAAGLAVLAAAAAAADRSPSDTGGAGAGAPITQPAPSVSAPPVLPAGFRWWIDPSGFQAAVPDQWAETADGPGTALFLAPGGTSSMRIRPAPAGGATAEAILLAEERGVRLAAYRRLRIEPVPGTPDAVWEYTYLDAKAGVLRVREQVMIRGGRRYLIEWRTPRAVWTERLSDLEVVLDTFRPPPGG
jgi:eukaryotic-like serine/threonine-protein kinase